MTTEKVRLSKIKTALTKLEGPDFRINCFPTESPEMLQGYPIDFRLFLEEIGNVDIAAGSQVGFQLLRMDDPQPLVGLNENSETLYSLDQFNFDDVCFGCHLAQNVRIFAVDVDANLYGFDISGDSYSIVGTELGDREFLSFTDWFVSFINNHVNNTPWLPRVHLI